MMKTNGSLCKKSVLVVVICAIVAAILFAVLCIGNKPKEPETKTTEEAFAEKVSVKQEELQNPVAEYSEDSIVLANTTKNALRLWQKS